MNNIIGVGTDIEKISRFKDKVDDVNFLSKIFSDEEIKYCKTRSCFASSLTARFCAKEAAIKALPEDINYRDVEVFMDGKKPKVRVRNLDYKFHVSLAHSKEYATAYVVVEKV